MNARPAGLVDCTTTCHVRNTHINLLSQENPNLPHTGDFGFKGPLVPNLEHRIEILDFVQNKGALLRVVLDVAFQFLQIDRMTAFTTATR